jgi:hypothetical protein
MVQYANTDEGACLHQPFGDLDVFFARRRIAAGMIMRIRIIAALLFLMAGINTSLGCTMEAFRLPTEISSTL